MAKRNNDIDGQLVFNLSTDSSNYVVQANELVMAKQSLKLSSAKIIRAVIMQIQPEDDVFKTYRITVTELTKLLHSSRSTLYRDIDRITDELMKSQIVLRAEDYKSKNNSKKRFVKMQWVTTCSYNDDDENGLRIQIHPELKPFLIRLKNKYTQYPLEDILRMKSVYALRIYEILQEESIMNFLPKNGAFIDITTADIRRCCNCEDKYVRWSQFKEKVLDRAVKEINECTFYTVTYVPIKSTGREYDLIRFHINMFYNSSKKELEK